MHPTKTVNKVLDFNGDSSNEKFGFVQNGDQVEYIWCKTCTKSRRKCRSEDK